MCNPSIVVAGRSLSEGGFGFYHPQPISLRRVIAQFNVGNGRWVGFLMDLPWCRFTAEGWYESGGRFLSAVPVGEPPPIAGAGHENQNKEKAPNTEREVRVAGDERSEPPVSSALANSRVFDYNRMYEGCLQRGNRGRWSYLVGSN